MTKPIIRNRKPTEESGDAGTHAERETKSQDTEEEEIVLENESTSNAAPDVGSDEE